MFAPYGKLPPAASISPAPFTVSIPQQQLEELSTLVRLSKTAPPTYENSQPDGRFGVTSEWLTTMRQKWLLDFDWRALEARTNSFPQFTTEIEDIKLHFLALFSEKPDAVPVVLLHGWPGSFLEFLPMLDLFRDQYTPRTLPYHFIVPSLPGYAFSSGPPLDRNYTNEDVARVVDRLMKGLGFESGYVAQGGDIGSMISRVLAVDYDSCKAAHLNFMMIPAAPPGISDANLSDNEKQALRRREEFLNFGKAYADEHATRPSTIGHVLSSSPLALLAWCGEKFLQWVDEPLPSQTILEFVSLYWLTETYPRSIYSYRENIDAFFDPEAYRQRWFIRKPLGFSSFPMELTPTPKPWLEATGNVVYFKDHRKGGHFAALEKPNVLKEDLTEFIAQVWAK
ncbi:putative epoxide hydrolase [Aspergillus steynii IBT 23096]|uniref:Putative epoxide hydrolase n=1 Tax=Aspergillus steynii IBT 23096 TaxID=1392250 RepID=A0A2I2GIN7_9EURO|nr:putative epoxide hydrolase [Aspergillus steynii IBT 23096]PLB52744.1 putative epoxide hydrolase [Aspergillus steynii IBT 23096]